MTPKLFVALFIAAGFVYCDRSSADIQVIPAPQNVRQSGDGFDPAKLKFITVGNHPADRFAATLLQRSLRETHGVNCEIVSTETEVHQLRLRNSLNDLDIAKPPVGPESYMLTTRPVGATVAAESDAGLFYGVQTLIQLLEQSRRDKAPVPGLFLNDHPGFGLRCRYFDASQYAGTIVTTRAGLESEIKQLARYKLNALVIDLYNLVPFKSFPAAADQNTLTASDWQYLVELAHQHHVTIIPSIQSFAQMYQVIWQCDEGKPYREETAPGLICPSRPESVRFLQSLYKDLITTFHYSPILGIGCSEVGMQWGGKYCPRCKARIDAGESEHDIYIKHVRACLDAVKAAAKDAHREEVRPMMWGDEFYMGYGGKRWVDIDKIPTDTIIGHWMYWKPYDGIGELMKRGYDVMYLSATYQHNNFLVDLSPEDPADGKWEALLSSGIRNVADQAQEAFAQSKKSPKGKALGGGCATFSQHDLRCWDTTWFAYALAAEYAWNPEVPALEKHLKPFTDTFAAVHYVAKDEDAGKAIATAFRELDAVKSDLERNNYLIRDFIGIYDVQDKCYTDNTLEGSLKLIDELATKSAGEGKKTIDDIRKRCENAVEVAKSQQQKLAAVMDRVSNVESLHHLILAAQKIENHAKRTEFLIDVAAWMRDGSKDAKRREDLLKQCQAMERETQVLFEQTFPLTHASRLTLDGNDSSGYAKALVSLQRIEKQLTAK